MEQRTSIQVTKDFLKKMNQLKIYKNQTQMDLLVMMAEIFEAVRPQYVAEWKKMHGPEKIKEMVRTVS